MKHNLIKIGIRALGACMTITSVATMFVGLLLLQCQVITGRKEGGVQLTNEKE